MQLGCTKKLQNFLKLNESLSAVDEAISPFFSWSASIVIINRRKIIAVVNDACRCGFVMYGVKASDRKNLESYIWDGVQAFLESEYIAPNLIARYLSDCGGKIVYTKTKGRSTVSRLNQFAQRITFWADALAPGILLQKHLSRSLNSDIISASGSYTPTRNILRQGFVDIYGVENAYECKAARMRPT